MNGKHSLDDLFARGLRDAEATPPAAVWEGVVRGRGWAHLALQRLRRNWGYGVAAALLLVGGFGYWMGTSADPAAPEQAIAHVEQAGPAPATTGAEQARALTPTTTAVPATEGSAPTAAPASSGTTSSSTTTAAAADHGMNVSRADHSRTVVTEAERPAQAAQSQQRDRRSSASTATSGGSRSVAGAEHHDAATTRDAERTEHAEQATSTAAPTTTGRTDEETLTNASATPATSGSKHDAATNTALPTTDGSANNSSPNASFSSTGTSFAAERMDRSLFATHQQGLRPTLAQQLAAASPVSGDRTPAYVLPAGDWWVGVQSGFYEEQRTWHGNDEALVKALERTEVPHYPWSIGVAGGRTFRSGWGISLGAEYLGARYRFEHEDRFVDRQERVTEYLVTLNTDVIASYTDTVVTVTEQRRKASATNSYSAVRVPLEVSFHRPWKRWQYGVRAGVAAEFATLRSGLTLSTNAEGSEYSVDPGQSAQRSNTLLSGSVGLDLGYLITERVDLWATPTYMRGLSPLSAGDAAYALPDRWGVRFRLAYTFPHR